MQLILKAILRLLAAGGTSKIEIQKTPLICPVPTYWREAHE